MHKHLFKKRECLHVSQLYKNIEEKSKTSSQEIKETQRKCESYLNKLIINKFCIILGGVKKHLKLKKKITKYILI